MCSRTASTRISTGRRTEPVEPGSLVFTGSYGYWPNEAAALHLIAMSQAL